MRNLGDAHKEDAFLDVYEEHFKKWRYKPLKLLEIGVQFGGSLKIWKEYFENAEITGVDILPECKKIETDRVKIEIGDQANKDFLDSLGAFDIVIDDGGHTMVQQQNSFEVLFPKLSPGGVYVIEDTHTSYWKQFLDKDLTTIDFCKNLVDDVNAEARESVRNETFPRMENPFPIESIHFYKSLIVIHKKNV